MANGLLETARAVSEAALATEGVHSLGTGRFVEAATYEAGEKISGVVVDSDEVRVHVVVLYPLPKSIPEISEDIMERVASSVGDRRTTVIVEDLEVADEDL